MRALILGCSGQDGSYLTEQLLADGHEVFGLVRRFTDKTPAVQIVGDILEQPSIERALRTARPDWVFNLAAVTSPGGVWGTPQPPLLAEVTGLGVLHILDAMLRYAPDARLVHASSSAIYDPGRYGLYGIAKQFAHEAVVGYRDRLQTSNAVLFSHTSPRQDPRFLARRICSTVARIAAGSDERLTLGDVGSRRSWGYAPDYVRALPLIAEHTPGDFVIATGRTHSVGQFTQAALDAAGVTWDRAVSIDLTLPHIPDEVHPQTAELRLAATKALGWKPETSLPEMVKVLLAA